MISVFLSQACSLGELLGGSAERIAVLAERSYIAEEALPVLEVNQAYREALQSAEQAEVTLNQVRAYGGEISPASIAREGQNVGHDVISMAIEERRSALADELVPAFSDRDLALQASILDQRRNALLAAAEAGVIGVAVGGGGVFLANEILAHRQAEKEARCRNLGKMLQEEQDSENAKGLQERIHRECLK